jgi:hypothetical protein
LINGWLAELELCVTWSMGRREEDLISKLGEMQLEVDKLHGWKWDVTLIESFFAR